MKVTIEIYCDDKGELLQHIKSIRSEIKKLSESDFDSDLIEINDCNCYGSHVVIIEP